jgi:acyl dehydratase
MPRLITFEDLAEGSVFWGPEVMADADEMVAYARKYDPWPFHVDAEAAKQTPFGGLIASGRLYLLAVVSIISMCIPDSGYRVGIARGIRTAHQAAPAGRPGDRLRLKLTIGGKRLASGGSRGHVESLHVLIRRDDTPVFSVERALLMATGRPIR